MSFTVLDFSIGVIFVAVTVALLIALRKLRRFEQERRQYIKEVDDFTAAPIRRSRGAAESERQAKKSALESLQRRFSLIRKFILPIVFFFVALILAIPFLEGAARSYVSLIVGAITVLIGIAARPFIENLISGLVLSLGSSVRLGDTVLIDDHYGTVEQINLTSSIIKIWDYRRYVVPNSEFIKRSFINYNVIDDFVWTRVEFFVSYDQDLDQVGELAKEAMLKCPTLAKQYGDPQFWVMGVEENRVQCWVVGWSESATDTWTTAHRTRVELIKKFNELGIVAHMSEVSLTDKRFPQKQAS